MMHNSSYFLVLWLVQGQEHIKAYLVDIMFAIKDQSLSITPSARTFGDLIMSWNAIYWITFFCLMGLMLLVTIPIVAYLELKDGKTICGYCLAPKPAPVNRYRFNRRREGTSIDEGIDLCYDVSHV